MPFQRGKRPDLASSKGLVWPGGPDVGRYTFRPVVKEDLALLEVWLRTPENAQHKAIFPHQL